MIKNMTRKIKEYMVNFYFNSRNLINNKKASVGERVRWVLERCSEVSIVTAFVKDPV